MNINPLISAFSAVHGQHPNVDGVSAELFSRYDCRYPGAVFRGTVAAQKSVGPDQSHQQTRYVHF